MRDRANTSDDPICRRGTRSIGALGLFTVGLLLALAFAGTAAAKQAHVFNTSFGGGELSLGEHAGIAVNSTSHDIYVADGTKIAQFQADGTPIRTFGTFTNATFVAVDNSSGASKGSVYVVTAGNAVAKFAADGTVESGWGTGGVLGGFEEIAGIAVDATGRLFVVETNYVVRPFTAAGAAQPTFFTSQGPSIGGIAADSVPDLYMIASSHEVAKFNTIGESVNYNVNERTDSTSLGIDQVSGDLYVTNGNPSDVNEYSGSCTGPDPCSVQDTFGQGHLGEAGGVTIDTGTKEVYVTDTTSGEVAVFSPILVPDTTAEPATEIRPTEFTMHGMVSAAGGTSASCQFQYVSLEHFEAEGFNNPSTATCSPAGPFTGSATTAVSATATGLEPLAEYPHGRYRYRLVSTNSNGQGSSAAIQVETKLPVAVAITPVTELTATTAQFNGTINPEGRTVTECVFEYGMGGAFDHPVPCIETAGDIGTGSSPVPVHADVSSLGISTEYQFRLKGKTDLGTTTTPQESFLTKGPSIGGEDFHATETSATLLAKVNPHLEEATYAFEFVSDADFKVNGYAGARSIPVGGEAVGSGEEPVEVNQQVDGLLPGTSYHFRVKASNASATNVGPDKVFTTFPPSSPGLPDGRAYEQATPPTPEGKNVTTARGDQYHMMAASPSGDATTYYAVSGLADTESSIEFPIYVALRGSEGWVSDGINPAPWTGTRTKILGYTEDLRGSYTVAWFAGQPASLYLREFGGKLTTIASGIFTKALPGGGGAAALATRVVTESANGGVVLVESPQKLTANATDFSTVRAGQNIYAWNKATGNLTLVDVLDNQSPPAEGAYAGPWDWLHETYRGGVNGGYYGEDTLSRDGSRAFFTAAGENQIYVREDPTSESGRTKLVSGSQKTNGSGPGGTDPNGPQPAIYEGATPSGRYVFFKSREELTNDANTGSGDESEALYRYDVDTGELLDLTPDAAEPNGPSVKGVGGFSEDGSYVYFVADGQFAPGATTARSLYVWHDGTIKFVAPVANGFEPADESIWNNYGGVSLQRSMRVAADGKSAVFLSEAGRPAQNAERSQIYRYEYGGTGTSCLSCDPTGAFSSQAQLLYPFTESFVQPEVIRPNMSRNMSANGKRFFFDTPSSLVGRDVNGVNDVYEWEADGEGTCASDTRSGGCIYLISTGTSNEPSFFGGASSSGNDVFFFTAQRLVGQDKDALYDVYDARVGGGIAAQNPVEEAPCEGSACLGPRTGPEAAPVTGTATFSGSGNEKPKTKKHYKKHYKKHHKKKHHKKQKSKRGKKTKSSHRQGGGNR